MTADHAGQTGGERNYGVRSESMDEVQARIEADEATRPAPVPGQAAREAAVEAVAERLSADYDSQRAWVKGDDTYRQAWREDAGELVDIVVAALSAAPGQGRCASCRGDLDGDCGHHSWGGLMALLDEHWPADIWPTLHHDDRTRDAGARIVSLIRWVDELRGDRL